MLVFEYHPVFLKIIVSFEDFFKNALGISLLSNSCLSAQFKGQDRQSNMHLKCHSYIYRWDGRLPKEQHNREVGPSWSPYQQTRRSSHLPETHTPKKLVNLLLIKNRKFPSYTCRISLPDCEQMWFHSFKGCIYNVDGITASGVHHCCGHTTVLHCNIVTHSCPMCWYHLQWKKYII